MADFGTVARPYARAVFDIAREANDLARWSKALAAAAAIAENRSARSYLSRPELGAAERSEFFAAVVADVPGSEPLAVGEGRNLLRLLSENDRLDAIPEIARQFEELKAEHENKVRVKLIAATPVDAATADKIAHALGRKLGRTVELELEVDESLLGGAIVRAEDMVIDDSLRTRLKRLAGSLVE